MEVTKNFLNFAPTKTERDSSSVGRASASQAEGRGFDPRLSLLWSNKNNPIFTYSMKSISSSKALWFVTCLIALASALLDFFTPAMGDDLEFWRHLGFHDYTAPNRLTLSFIAAHLFGCNGRLFDIVGPIVINLLPKVVASVFMGLMSGLFFAVIIHAIRIPKKNYNAFTIVVAAIILLITPWWDSLWLRVCQFNYTWGAIFCIGYVYLFFNTDDKPQLGKIRYTLLFVLAVFAGATHEQTGIAMSVTFICWAIFEKRYRNLSPKRRVMLIGVLLGTALPVFAPAIWLRFFESQNSFHYPILPLIMTTLPLLLALIVIIIIGLAFPKSRNVIVSILKGESGIYLSIGLIAGLIAIACGVPGRTGILSECCSLIILSRFILRANINKNRKLAAVIGCACGVFIITHYSVSVIAQYKVNQEYDNMLTEYTSSSDGIVFADYTPRYTNLSFLTLDRIKGVPDSDDYWLNRCLMLAYRSDSIPLVVLPVDLQLKMPLLQDSISSGGVTVYSSQPQNLAVTQDGLVVQSYNSDAPRIVVQTKMSDGKDIWVATPWVLDPGDYRLPTVKTLP